MFICRTNSAAVSVKIGGVACAIDTISDTSLTCTTGARSSSIDTAVSLQVATNGIADQVCIPKARNANKTHMCYSFRFQFCFV